MKSNLPRGTVTFLFTDIEGSTQLLQRLKQDYRPLLDTQERILRDAIAQHNGQVVDTQGDSFFAAFPRAGDALDAVVEAQRALAAYEWQASLTVRVRMALHTGEPNIAGDRYLGIDVHRAARICAAGHGGQVLLSQTTRDLVESELPENVTLRDLGEHRLKDLRRPKHLYQMVIGGLPADFPPLKTLDALPNNLPVQLTSFIGRDREISQIRHLLGATRLLSLTGVGGTGKTRLALQVASEVLEAEQFPHGVWLVELASLSDPALVPQAVATALGVRELMGRTFSDLLRDSLSQKNLLLVLDNCEHLIQECAQLADTLLHSAPHLKILTTSREALGIAGETGYPVPSLGIPDVSVLRSSSQTPESLSQYDAVRLFIDRALAVQPQFQLTNQNALAVAQVCARLDGIPLAIELAAARVKGLSVDQIASRLDDRFRLLTGGSRTALPRQRTLQAAIDWSYKLLSDTERVLLPRLSVFSGGWSLEAAEFVCAGGNVEADTILDLLLRLVDKSLVVADAQGDETHYHMLETIRQYAQEKLDESGESQPIRNQHLEFFLKLAMEANPELFSADQPLWIERLDTEHDNFRGALRWSLDGHRIELGIALAAELSNYWTHANHVAEGRAWLAELLAHNEPPLPMESQAVALSDSGWLAFWENDFSAARLFEKQSLVLFREIGDRQKIATALNILGIALAYGGDIEAARPLLEEALELRRDLDLPYFAANTMVALGFVNWKAGQINEARRLFEESLAIKDRLQHHAESHYPLLSYGYMELEEGNPQEAQVQLTRGLDILNRLIIDRAYAPHYLEGLAFLAATQEQWTRAAQLLGATARWRQELNAPRFPYLPDLYEQTRATLLAHIDQAQFTAAFLKGQSLTMEQAIALALNENQ